MNVIKNCRHGLMAYNTRDTWVGRSLNEYGEFSESEVKLFHKILKSGMTVIDVGANIGTHTLVFAKCVGDSGVILAYEPQRLVYYTLCANIILNNLTNVICMQNVVGKSEGRINVPELDSKKANNFGGLELGIDRPDAKGNCSVKLVKLDQLTLNRLDFIKIDVEGMEADVLLGAKDLIQKHRPMLYVEGDRPQNINLLVKILRTFNYTIYFHAAPLFNKDNFMGIEENIFGNIISVNVFCHPVEVPMPFAPEEFQLTTLSKDGSVVLHNNSNNADITEHIVKEVAQSCVKAAVHFSENLHQNDKALSFTHMALHVNPEDFEAYYRTAIILCKRFDFEPALTSLDCAIEKNPNNFNANFNRAVILVGMNKYAEATDQYRKILIKYPESVNSHFNLGCCLIATEQLEEGWKEYEWRFKLPKVKQFCQLLPDIPFWDGQSLNNKKILLFAEQGNGDTVQFIRYASYLKQKEAHVTLACGRYLFRLLKQCEGIDEFVLFNFDDQTIIEGNFDFICSLMSLPQRFGVDCSTGYIKPTLDWKMLYQLDKSFLNIGIVWAGSPAHENDCGRSCHQKYFRKLQEIPFVKLHSLQKGSLERYWSDWGKIDLSDKDMNLLDYTESLNDFNDTANFIQELDLIITVDTAIAHIAGAMNKPTWILLGTYPDPRWFIDRNDTPWYPSVKLFRQPSYKAEWDVVFENVKEELLKTYSSSF